MGRVKAGAVVMMSLSYCGFSILVLLYFAPDFVIDV